MRVIELSGQPGGQHDEAEHDDAEQAPFRPDVTGPAADPGEHRLASRLRDTLAARHASQAAHQEDARLAAAEVMRTARRTGAKQVVSYLGGQLPDDWMLIRGYQNSSGGIGQLLVGNHGVAAMTSLNLDATVRCHGDKWRAEKIDRRSGQSLGEIHLLDQAGRSPSAQLNQAADILEHLLRSEGAKISVLRAVLLSWLKELPKILDRAGRRQIERLLTP